jgi:hypothetical protein
MDSAIDERFQKIVRGGDRLGQSVKSVDAFEILADAY